MKEDLGIGKLTISVIAAALLANIAAADAQQASDPRVADLVQAGMVRVGLFSTQYTKDPASGELKGVRVDIARALAAQIGDFFGSHSVMPRQTRSQKEIQKTN